MLKFSLILLSMLIGYAGLAQAEHTTPPELIVGFYEFPPWIYSDENGQIQGPVYEVQREILIRSGYQARFRSLPSARLYNALRDGSVHLWLGAPGKNDMTDYTLESRSLLGHTLLNLYYPAGQPAPRIPDDLRNKNVILISGYTYWPSVNRLLNDPSLNIKTHRTSSHEAALHMLARQRGDYLINYASPVTATSSMPGEQPLEYVPLDKLEIRFIVSRNAPKAEQIIRNLDRTYQEMLKEGPPPFPELFD